MIISEKIQISFDYNTSEYDDIIRCLNTLYLTPVGSCALNREFGIDMSILDQPINIAKTLFSVELIEKTERYEPRVRVKEVLYTSEEAKIIPKVVIEYVGNTAT